MLQSPRSIQTLRRLFHQYHKTFSPLNFSDYEAISRCEQEVPEYFNFASDVLDKYFEELGFLSTKVANVLSGPRNLQRGDRVLVILPRFPELLASKNRCIITTDVLAPVVYLVASKCQFLKTKIIVSESSRESTCLTAEKQLLKWPPRASSSLQRMGLWKERRGRVGKGSKYPAAICSRP
uniref:Uncharacterized protein n=1 Tax=Accipiter nisus TaxID=211598 RepID=A0A8B9M8T0_9AVES